jgi:hypothetical protein
MGISTPTLSLSLSLSLSLGPGYLAFMQAMTVILDPDSPVAMAFLSHIIERSALPSKHTMESISPVILSTMKQAGTRPSSMPFFKKIMSSVGLAVKPTPPSHPAGEFTRIKLNATVIWSLLAEKYAGEMCMHMWNDQVGRLLIQMLVDVNEDLMVRLFSLMALEKFSLTGKFSNSDEVYILGIFLSHPLFSFLLSRHHQEHHFGNQRYTKCTATGDQRM